MKDYQESPVLADFLSSLRILPRRGSTTYETPISPPIRSRVTAALSHLLGMLGSVMSCIAKESHQPKSSPFRQKVVKLLPAYHVALIKNSKNDC